MVLQLLIAFQDRQRSKHTRDCRPAAVHRVPPVRGKVGGGWQRGREAAWKQQQSSSAPLQMVGSPRCWEAWAQLDTAAAAPPDGWHDEAVDAGSAAAESMAACWPLICAPQSAWLVGVNATSAAGAGCWVGRLTPPLSWLLAAAGCTGCALLCGRTAAVLAPLSASLLALGCPAGMLLRVRRPLDAGNR